MLAKKVVLDNGADYHNVVISKCSDFPGFLSLAEEDGKLHIINSRYIRYIEPETETMPLLDLPVITHERW